MSTSKPKAPVLAGLDIGSTKVSFVIGTVNPEGKIEVAGVGTAPNTGIRQGVVVNIEATTDSIRKAKEEAELMSGYTVSEVWVGVAGSHISSFDSKGMVAIKNREVTASEIDRVIEAAKAVAVPTDRSVLHVLPREFKVDGQDGITDPIGMSGIRLEANVHIVTGGQSAINNTVKCVEKAGLKIAGLVLSQLASATAVMSNDEKNLGVCVVDMGGGACNALYFVNGSVAHSSVIPVGGQHFTHDVAVGLRTPQFAAEELKKKHGCAMASMVNENETVEVEGVGGRKSRVIPRKDLADVIEARAEETLNLIANDIRMSGLMPMLGGGIVLTGGASNLDGLIEMGEFIFDIPVRRGAPREIGGLTDVVKSGEFSAAVGLLQYALGQRKDLLQTHQQQQEVNIGESLDGITKKIKEFFGQIF
ncbi:cell division protein FtsA [Bdellovibrio bacteriovorus]|uniref:Cell division protein FtsA n=2 Tax=Bdellovibrio bacteriovorus TaxID=959 RepID=Q6MIG8_BDEBA|nr:cell division protein FtsA [Bdellovibrio bacteriovorus]AFY02795.1 cell division protein FtsA [Bdellovibrio bacteriovorus str. Tiberius]AHZ83575.1 cell division protein FtsA [Bdellovibrio bacteriovorus]BEV69545.1 Cell division protein FtsA [Bdellovibrio bacteriovorus]CAE80945.1 cell division protein FtsA [Bdellovibrio bacteriovorus HD100]